MDAYQHCGQAMVALQSVPLEKVGNYGLFAGVWDDREQTLLKIGAVREKPTVQEAQEYMAVPSREKDENYYGAFGSYIITPEIFQRLDEAVKQNLVNSKGEVELTDALAWAASRDGLMGFVPDGESFDLGNADAYRNTVANFGEQNR
jgi:UTP-glucose-1-phosphate uridylyltransferase